MAICHVLERIRKFARKTENEKVYFFRSIKPEEIPDSTGDPYDLRRYASLAGKPEKEEKLFYLFLDDKIVGAAIDKDTAIKGRTYLEAEYLKSGSYTGFPVIKICERQTGEESSDSKCDEDIVIYDQSHRNEKGMFTVCFIDV